MIYEGLDIILDQIAVPLRVADSCLTIVNSSVPIRILGTSRFVNAEASMILKPKLRTLLSEPPKLFIEAQSLVGLIMLRCGFSHRTTLLEALIRCLASSSAHRGFHRNRRGRLSINDLRYSLHLERFCEIGCNSTVKSLATFILRTVQYRKTRCEGEGPFPPITVVIDIPTTSPSTTIVRSTSRAMSIVQNICRILHRKWAYTGLVDASWLMRAFTCHTHTCCWWRHITFCLLIRHDHGDTTAPPGVLQAFCAAIEAGVVSAWSRHDRCLVYAGGVYGDAEKDS